MGKQEWIAFYGELGIALVLGVSVVFVLVMTVVGIRKALRDRRRRRRSAKIRRYREHQWNKQVHQARQDQQ
jgi:hypothetical protein